MEFLAPSHPFFSHTVFVSLQPEDLPFSPIVFTLLFHLRPTSRRVWFYSFPFRTICCMLRFVVMLFLLFYFFSVNCYYYSHFFWMVSLAVHMSSPSRTAARPPLMLPRGAKLALNPLLLLLLLLRQGFYVDRPIYAERTRNYCHYCLQEQSKTGLTCKQLLA